MTAKLEAAVSTSSNVTLAPIQARPWKHIGYRGFSEFLASDNDFLVLRRFSTLSVRILLALQDELVELETQLRSLEDQLCSAAAPNIHNGSFRQETPEVRLKLVRTIEEKLRAYNELLLQHSELRARPRVPPKDIESISNWSHNNHNAILKDGTEYITHSKDLIAVVPKPKTLLRQFLERSSHFRLLRLWRKHSEVEDENIHYSSDQRIEAFVALIIMVVGLAMLIAPLWILAYVSSTVHRLAIITSFVLVFLCFVSSTTVARPFETLGAAAA